MEREERLAFLELTEGRDPKKGGYEDAVIIAGVRSGKTMLDSVIATYESARWSAMGADGTYILSRFLIRGQLATGILIAQDKKGAGIARGYLVGNFLTLQERTGAQFLAETQGQEKAITGEVVKLAAPIEIGIYTANAYSVRGATGLWFIGDESAWWKSEEGSYNQDVKVMKAVRSRFATLSRLKPKRLLTSSKNGEQGIIWEAWKKREKNDALVVMASSWELNPDLDQEFLDREEEKDPEAFAVEYGKAWEKSGDANIFLPAEIVDACVTKDIRQRAPQPGREYVAWLDAAFKKDRFFFGLGHAERRGDQVRAVMDHVRHWTPRSVKGKKTTPLDDEMIVQEIVADLRLYSTDTVRGDQYCDVPLQRKFEERGIKFVYSPVSDPEKAEAFKNLRGALRSVLVDLLDDEVTNKDLKGLQKTLSRTGHMQIAAPHRRGCYDDGANVVARIVQKLLPLSAGLDISALNSQGAGRDDRHGRDWDDRDGREPGARILEGAFADVMGASL